MKDIFHVDPGEEWSGTETWLRQQGDAFWHTHDSPENQILSYASSIAVIATLDDKFIPHVLKRDVHKYREAQGQSDLSLTNASGPNQ